MTRSRPFTHLTLLIALLVPPTLAAAQALQHLPEKPMLLFKVNNPRAVSTALAEFFARLGIDQLEPGLRDPLALLKRRLNLHNGIDEGGELVIAMYDEVMAGTQPRFLALIPVSDYRAFLGNFPQGGKAGNLDTVEFPGAMIYAASRGRYAVLTPNRELMDEKTGGLELAAPLAKVLQERDAAIYVNTRVLAEKFLPHIQGMRAFLAEAQRRDAIDLLGPREALERTWGAQMLAVVEQLLQESDGCAAGLKLDKDGITSTSVFSFNPDSRLGRAVVGLKSSADDLLAELPAGQYLAVGGVAGGGETLWSMYETGFLDAVRALTLPEAEARKVEDQLSAMKRAVSSMSRMSIGLLGPKAGRGGLVRSTWVLHGDAEAFVSLARMMAQEGDAITNLALPGLTPRMTFTDQAIKADGLAFSASTVEFGAANAEPELREAIQFFTAVFGQTATNHYGVLDPKRLVGGTNLDETELAAAVRAARAASGPLAQSSVIRAAASRLPREKLAVLYVDLGAAITTGLEQARAAGAPAPMLRLPANQPMLGISLATEGSSLRVDSHVPTDLVANIASAIFQWQIGQGMMR